MDYYGTAMTQATEPKKWGISGSTLKLIAIFTMLIDHTAATILDNILAQAVSGLNLNSDQAIQQYYQDYGLLIFIDQLMRMIGRVAFPIFCFLLVEGMIHTHNKWRYALRLGLFALLSEIPFDLAFYAKPFFWGYQNVYFTLFIGLLVLIGFDQVQNNWSDKKWLPVPAAAGAVATGFFAAYLTNKAILLFNNLSYGMDYASGRTLDQETFLILFASLSIVSLIVYYVMGKTGSFANAGSRFTDLGILVAGFMLAEVLRTDYSGFGVLTIAVMYGLRRSSLKSMLGGCITLTIMSLGEVTAFFDLALAYLYNGKRGWNLKYVFYLFYPVHLFILYLICRLMGILYLY